MFESNGPATLLRMSQCVKMAEENDVFQANAPEQCLGERLGKVWPSACVCASSSSLSLTLKHPSSTINSLSVSLFM